MADRDNYGGLSSVMDMSKVNPYGVDDQRLQEIQDAQKQALEALQRRYENPNWFKVAAGFLKPQLGGFMASLGSASEALGENVEQQRAQELPIAQMKIQMAQQNLLMGQNKKAADMVAARKSAGLPMTPDFAAEVARIAPESAVAKALQTEIKTQQEQQGLALQRIQTAKALGRDPNPADLAFLQQSNAPTSQPKSGTDQQNAIPIPVAPSPAITGKPMNGIVSVDDFLNVQQNLEGLKPGEKAQTSSATGPYGLIDSTRTNLQKKYNLPEGYGSDPAVSKQYGQALIKDIEDTILKPNNLDNTTLNQRLGVWFGNDMPKLMNADPSTKIGEILSKEVLKANGLDPNVRVGKLISRVEGNLWDQGINPKHSVGTESITNKNEPVQKPEVADKNFHAPLENKNVFNGLPVDLNTADPSKIKFETLGFANVPESATLTDASIANWNRKEKAAEDRLNVVQTYGAPEGAIQTVARQNISQLLNFADESKANKDVIRSVVNKMNENPDIVNALLAAADKGFTGSWNGLSISLGVPVKEFMNHLNSPEEQKVAQMVLLALDNANFINGKLKGLSTTANIPASEANLITAGTLSQNTNYSTIIHTLGQLENNLDRYKNLYDGYQIATNQYSDRLSKIAPTHQIVNSQWWNNTNKYYNKIADQYNEHYNKSMSPKPKKQD